MLNPRVLSGLQRGAFRSLETFVQICTMRSLKLGSIGLNVAPCPVCRKCVCHPHHPAEKTLQSVLYNMSLFGFGKKMWFMDLFLCLHKTTLDDASLIGAKASYGLIL